MSGVCGCAGKSESILKCQRKEEKHKDRDKIQEEKQPGDLGISRREGEFERF